MTNLQAKREARYQAFIDAGKPGVGTDPIAARVDDMPGTGSLRDQAEAKAAATLLNPLPEGAVVRTDIGSDDPSPNSTEDVRLEFGRALLTKVEGASPEIAAILANAGNAILGPIIRADDETVKSPTSSGTTEQPKAPTKPGSSPMNDSEEEGKPKKAADDNPMSAILDALSGITKRLDAIEKKERDDDDSGSEDVPDRKPGQEGKPKGSDSEDDFYTKMRNQGIKVRAIKDKQGQAAFDSTTDHLFYPIQARADRVYTMNGAQAPKPMLGETLNAYRRRLLTPLQASSATFRHSDLKVAQHDPASFAAIDADVYKSAEDAFKNPATVPLGQLREHVETRNGHQYTRFYGRPISWLSSFAPPGRRVRKILQRNDSGFETTLYQR